MKAIILLFDRLLLGTARVASKFMWNCEDVNRSDSINTPTVHIMFKIYLLRRQSLSNIPFY